MRWALLLCLGCGSSRVDEVFALGQLGVAWEPVETEPAARKLAAQLERERDPEVRDRIVEALGKLGGEPAVAALRAALAGRERGRAAIALGLLAKNGKLQGAVEVERLHALLSDGDDAVRFGAAYALYRMKQPTDACLHDASWLVRATCARGAADPVSLLDDPDERVAAEAARTLARQVVACSGDCRPMAALAAKWRPQMTAVTAAIAAEPITHPDWPKAVPAGDDCLLALSHDRALGRIDRIGRCDEKRRAQAAALLPKLEDDLQLRARLATEKDLAALAAVAESMADRKLADPQLLSRLRPLDGPDAIEAIQALCRAAGAAGLRDAIPELRRRAEKDHPAVEMAARAALKALGEKVTAPVRRWQRPRAAQARVRLETKRGTIVLQLGHAAGTVENFVKLVRRGFYDGLTFHRVVPDFVVQGGDPRGDGSGGPGWTIPCEINPVRYREGTVGMALSGPDTGGSQFFIALSPQPHLDGRYTVFGQVVEGMEVVRAIEEGDVIQRARLME
jgi:cyclophilin family peptidyl-prolyl cis-trans isomerase/HEAT repeat protein